MNKKLRKFLSAFLSITFLFTVFTGTIFIQTAQADEARPIPGRIEAEDFTSQTGFSGNFIETNANASGGKDIGYVSAGNTLSYFVNVEKSGSYEITFRYAAQSSNTDSFSLRDSEGNVLCRVSTPATGGWTTWRTITTYAELTAGEQILTIYCDKAGYNIDCMDFISLTEVATPTILPPPGTYALPVNVTLTTKTPGASIYYTLDGTDPTKTSNLYESAVTISSNTVLKAIGIKEGLEDSDIASFSYIFDENAKAAAPIASRESGSYGGTQSVTLSTTSYNAQIYYTTDGTDPETSVTGSTKLYNSAISISTSTTLKAITVAESLNPSDIATYNYTITAVAPTSNLVSGAIVGEGMRIQLSSSTSGASIYYTTDGSDPTTESTLYSGPIILSGAMADSSNNIIIKAVAAGSGYTTSSISTFTYIFDPDFVTLTDEASIDKVISQMTLDEKVALLGGSSGRLAGSAGGTLAISRLGIPGTSLSDGPAGIRITLRPSGFTDSQGNQTVRAATWWPNGAARASTWNTALEEQMGIAWGKEMYFFGNDLLLGPGANIHRHVLNGRNFEYYSEDPLLSGKIGAAEIIGIQSEGVGATIKHYAANNQETGRNNLPTTISKRALREIYLKSFEYIIRESQPWAVMTAYNQINGVSTAQDYDLITTVLREEWGFEGFVMTDWSGQGNASYWPSQPGNNAYSSLVKAGNDVCEPRGNVNNVNAGLQAGFITEDDIDACVRRILEYVIKTPSFKGKELSTEPNPYADENEAIAFNVSVESMVLLKNNTVADKPALPITNGNIATIGNATSSLVLGGTGSGSVNADSSRYVQLVQALRNIYTGGDIIDATTLGYAQVSGEMQPTEEQLTDLVNEVGSVVLTIKRTSGEFSDVRTTKGAYYLTDAEQNLIDLASRICREAGKPFVVVLNMGTFVEMESWKDKADAILLVWEPGIVVAKPIAAVLTGAANPSGKLSTTIPIDVQGYYNDDPTKPYAPAQDNFGTSSGVIYDEDIYVGYRYYDAFNVPVSYEFGYGMNYSAFEYSNLQLSSSTFDSIDSTINVSVDIKNISPVPGKEVVQFYVGAPGKSMPKPVKELKGFAKTNELVKGESQTVSTTLDAMLLASFDEARSSWVVEPGTYKVYAAASSKDIRQVATFTVEDELVVETVNDVLAPDKDIDKFKPDQSQVAISSIINNINISTPAGVAPVLPSVVQAVYTDGSLKDVPVTWDSIDPSSYANAGRFTVYGTVADSLLKAVANINVTEPTVVLSAPAAVIPEDTFTVGISLDYILQDVYAEDITLKYDPAVFDYIEVTPANESIKILKQDPSETGTLRIIAANIGGVAGDSTPILDVSFKVKEGIVNVSSDISVSTAKLGVMPEGTVVEADLTSKTIDVVIVVDKSALGAAISAAQSLYDNAVVGTDDGNYRQADKTAFGEAIAAANAVYTDPNASQTEVDDATAALNAAIAAFEASVITAETGDINDSSEIDVGDLAIIAYYYGADPTGENWAEAKIADINKDNKVDIEDLAFIASRMKD